MDDSLRVKVRTYQSLDFDDLSLKELEDFVDSLRAIEAKLPYLVSFINFWSCTNFETREKILSPCEMRNFGTILIILALLTFSCGAVHVFVPPKGR